MKKLIIEPKGWPCKLSECPAGHFVFGGDLCFKSEYIKSNGHIEAYCDSGESFWGSANEESEINDTVVQPVIAVWEDEESEADNE